VVSVCAEEKRKEGRKIIIIIKKRNGKKEIDKLMTSFMFPPFHVQ